MDLDALAGRRRFVRTGAMGALYLAVRGPLVATAACVETDDNPEGPFYKPGAPDRETLVEPGLDGTLLTLRGRIATLECAPLAGAVLDVWHADDSGGYDLSGFTLRGRFHTDRDGAYRIETILPKPYRVGGPRQFRPAHIHLKVSAPGARSLTTQLYFEGDPYNARDPGFRRSLMLSLDRLSDHARAATFDFALRTG